MHHVQVKSTATRKRPMPLPSSSENSDIVTLGDFKEDEHAGPEEVAASEELYLGTSCSSQYSFGAIETGRFPTAPPKKLKKCHFSVAEFFLETHQSIDLNHFISLPVF